VVDPDPLELLTPGSATSISGAIRVPLTAIRGLGAETVRHILQMRAVFGPFTSLLDFLRRIEIRVPLVVDPDLADADAAHRQDIRRDPQDTVGKTVGYGSK